MSTMTHSPLKPRRRKQGIDPFLAGLIGIVIVIIVTYLGFTKRLPWANDWELHAVVPDSNALVVNSPVRIAGVNVGKVTKIERAEGDAAKITMAIKEEGRPIHDDARVKIRPRLFLEGNFFIDLQPGSASSPSVGDGHTLGLAQSSIPVQFDQVLGAFTRTTRQGLRELLDEYATALETGGARALRDTFPDLGPAFRNSAVAFEATRGEREDDLVEFIRGSAKTAEALASDERRLEQLLVGLDATFSATADRATELRQTLGGLAGVLRQSDPALRALDRAIPPATQLAKDARPALREAPETLDLANPVLDKAERLLRRDQLPALVRDLRPTLRTLSRTSPKLISLFELVKPVSQCVQDRVLPALQTPLEDGVLSTGLEPWREFVSTAVGLAKATQNFDGNGYATRYYGLGVNDESVGLNQIPSLGDVLTIGGNTLVGSRPARPDQPPPFRPDVDCTTQAAPNLKARSVAPRRARKLPAPTLSSTEKQMLGERVNRIFRAQRRELRAATK